MKLIIKDLEYNLPENIESMTWLQLTNIAKLKDMTYLNVLAALCDLPIEVINQLTAENGDILKIYNTIAWISDFDYKTLLEDAELPTKIGNITVNSNFDSVAKFGQQIEILQFMNTQHTMFEIRNEILKIFFGYQLMGLKTWDNEIDYQETVNKCAAVDAFRLTSFFLTKLKQQTKGGNQSNRLNRQQILKTLKQVFLNLTSLVFGRR